MDINSKINAGTKKNKIKLSKLFVVKIKRIKAVEIENICVEIPTKIELRVDTLFFLSKIIIITKPNKNVTDPRYKNNSKISKSENGFWSKIIIFFSI